MEIQYSPELPEEDQLALKGVYETMYGGTLLFPNDNMDYEVAATTWTNLIGCPEVQGRDHARRDPRLRQGDLGSLRRRAGQRLRASRARRP